MEQDTTTTLILCIFLGLTVIAKYLSNIIILKAILVTLDSTSHMPITHCTTQCTAQQEVICVSATITISQAITNHLRLSTK
jgi:hypothetical protein